MPKIDVKQIKNISLTNTQFTSSEQDLGTLNWTATTAPVGVISKRYKWTRNGNEVNMYFKITATIAGLLVSSVIFDLPADMPVPNTFNGQPNNFIITLGNGLLSGMDNPLVGTADSAKLFKNSNGAYQIQVDAPNGLSANRCWGKISYIA